MNNRVQKQPVPNAFVCAVRFADALTKLFGEKIGRTLDASSIQSSQHEISFSAGPYEFTINGYARGTFVEILGTPTPILVNCEKLTYSPWNQENIQAMATKIFDAVSPALA